ncbi:hypothetical protein bAD24_I14375 [Burkholderia sp. AD24]|nr:hypothetical protein bAD24_I14375 [Burkholderia sp. AD24]
MTDIKQNGIGPEPTATVQQTADHMRVDFAQTGAYRPQDLRLVLGDIKSSVIVSAVDPMASIGKQG